MFEVNRKQIGFHTAFSTVVCLKVTSVRKMVMDLLISTRFLIILYLLLR